MWGDPGGSFADGVVGESHYQDELSALAERLQPSFPNGARMKFHGVLVCEVDNKFDENAIYVAPVVDGATGAKVGYLPRDRASELTARVRSAGGIVACHAALIGGGVLPDGTQKSWGVVLDLGDR